MDLESNDEARVRRNIVEATVEHYPLLSETQEVNVKVASACGNALACVKRLSDSLVKLHNISNGMTRAGQHWRREKQIALSTVAQHQKLLSFLEAPMLLDDCIRNEMYHEALMVLEHITRSAKPMDKVDLFRCVEYDTRCTLERALAEFVLPRMAGQLTVASSVKVTTFFRRLGVAEDQIRQLFLWKRAEYIDRLLHEAEESGVPYSRIFRFLTTFKVHVSEFILQYTACFSSTGSGSCNELVEWCHKRAYTFVKYLRHSLNKITNGSELASVIDQCYNCVTSTALVHMDISGLINETLSARVKALFAEQVALAVQSYTASMMTFSWRPLSELRWQDPPTRAKVTPTSDVPSIPPVSLVQWLPLAYALNGLLTAFNTIRKCIVPGIGLFCVSKVEGLFQMVTRDLERDKDLLTAVEGGEKQVYLLFVDAFVNDFYPHVLACLRELLGVDAQRLLVSSIHGSIESLRSILPRRCSSSPSETLQQTPMVLPPESSPSTPPTTSVAEMDV